MSDALFAHILGALLGSGVTFFIMLNVVSTTVEMYAAKHCQAIENRKAFETCKEEFIK